MLLNDQCNNNGITFVLVPFHLIQLIDAFINFNGICDGIYIIGHTIHKTKLQIMHNVGWIERDANINLLG